MKKLLLSILALCALSMVSTQISAKAGDGEKKVQGTIRCNTCHKEMGKEKHHCQCAHEVCVKPVKALEHAPMQKVCENKDRCPEGTTLEKNKHGKDVCVEIRAEKIEHPMICDTTCTWACPSGYTEEEMTSGHKAGIVHDNRQEAKQRRMMNKDMMKDNGMSRKASKAAEAA